MIALYFLIASFTFGKFYGEIEPFESRPTFIEWFWLAVLSLGWPLVIYLYLKDAKND